MLSVGVLASSSKANSTVVSSGRTHVLIDAGLPYRRTFERLSDFGVAPDNIAAILLTHEHIDHAAGVAKLVRKLNVPVYATLGTASQIDWENSAPKIHLINPGHRFQIGELEILPFSVPHDAEEPVGFSVRAGGCQFSIATDLGSITPEIGGELAQANILLIEANHDVDMLGASEYPSSLKRRVTGQNGHLSNQATFDYLGDHSFDFASVILGHLSEGNNDPELVRLMAEHTLMKVPHFVSPPQGLNRSVTI